MSRFWGIFLSFKNVLTQSWFCCLAEFEQSAALTVNERLPSRLFATDRYLIKRHNFGVGCS